MAGWLDNLNAWARALKRDIIALWLAARSPMTPLTPKIVAAAVAGYALSPIDLIPDFIPVLGYLDDLLIIPLGIVVVKRLMPQSLMAYFQMKASQQAGRPTSYVAAAAIVLAWCAMAASVATWQLR
jgi:uncharacterized membrane protein YkvA (DUF1232 family)